MLHSEEIWILTIRNHFCMLFCDIFKTIQGQIFLLTYLNQSKMIVLRVFLVWLSVYDGWVRNKRR